MKNLQDVLMGLCKSYRLTLKEKFVFDPNKDGVYGGLNNDGVFKALSNDGNLLVLKVAVSDKSIIEIKTNIIGYQRLREQGLEKIVPKIFFSEYDEQFAVLLMEYCGDDFLTQTRKSSNAISQYVALTKELEKIYSISRQGGEYGKKMVSLIISMIKAQYEDHLFMSLDKNRSLAKKIATIPYCIDFGALRICCFASWDFVPENIFLTPNGLKYVDPHEDILGIPIIDLACFAGLIKLYALPQAEEGYRLLENFALTKVASLLNAPEELSLKLFYLGRILQCFLSAGFRVISDPDRAHRIFLEGKDYLEKIVI